MARKTRKIVNEEVHWIVTRMLAEDSRTIEDIAKPVDLSTRTISKIAKKH